MKIFLAGHKGLVGSAILRKLIKKKYRNIILADKRKLNLLDQAKVLNFLKKKKPDLVIIAAGKVGGIYLNDNYSADFIYENLLSELQSAGDAGEFYTPRAVTEFIVSQVNPELHEKILDPACGTGGFLVNVIEHLRNKAKNEEDQKLLQEAFLGIEKKHLPFILCMTNLLLHGIDIPKNVIFIISPVFYK